MIGEGLTVLGETFCQTGESCVLSVIDHLVPAAFAVRTDEARTFKTVGISWVGVPDRFCIHTFFNVRVGVLRLKGCGKVVDAVGNVVAEGLVGAGVNVSVGCFESRGEVELAVRALGLVAQLGQAFGLGGEENDLSFLHGNFKSCSIVERNEVSSHGVDYWGSLGVSVTEVAGPVGALGCLAVRWTVVLLEEVQIEERCAVTADVAKVFLTLGLGEIDIFEMDHPLRTSLASVFLDCLT